MNFLLIIKSKINQGNRSTVFPAIEFYFRKLTDKFYLLFYLISLLFFLFIIVSSLGIASENELITINFFNDGAIETFNFLKFGSILLLQSLFWKMMISAVYIQNENNWLDLVQLYSQTSKERFSILQKIVFVEGFGLRLLAASFLAIPFVIHQYFDSNLLVNIGLALMISCCAIYFLNVLEVCFLYFSSKLKINFSIITLSLFVIGFLIVAFFGNDYVYSVWMLIVFCAILIFLGLLLRQFLVRRL